MKNCVANDIAEHLKEYHTSESDAITARGISEIFNVKGKPLRDVIASLRERGIPICSSSSGYWYSEEEPDIRQTIHHLQGRVTHINRVIDGLKGALTK